MINKIISDGNTVIDLSQDTLISSDQLASGVEAYDRSGTLITGKMEESHDETTYLSYDSSNSSRVKQGTYYLVHASDFLIGFGSKDFEYVATKLVYSKYLDSHSRTKIGNVPASWVTDIAYYSNVSADTQYTHQDTVSAGFDTSGATPYLYISGNLMEQNPSQTFIVAPTGGAFDYNRLDLTPSDATLLNASSFLTAERFGSVVQVKGIFNFKSDHDDANEWLDLFQLPTEWRPPIDMTGNGYNQFTSGSTNHRQIQSLIATDGAVKIQTIPASKILGSKVTSETSAGIDYSFYFLYPLNLGKPYTGDYS